MSTIIQRLFAFVGIVFFFGCATLVSAADDPNKKLSDARESRTPRPLTRRLCRPL